jgi:hypothetical protein
MATSNRGASSTRAENNMGKTLPVVWAEEAVRDAVRRVARALQTVDKDALLLGKLGVTTQDLWCLVDAGRATLEQTEAVSSAVASAHLSGVDLPADWVDTLGKVASGEVTADDAVQAAVDGELRDRITRAIATAKCSDDSLVSEVARLFMPPTKDDRADAVMAVVAPALRKAYLDGHDVGYAAANVPALADLVVRRQALANVLGVTDAGGASGYYRMIQDVADLRAELDAVKADRDKLNDEALRWTEIAGRHAEEIEQLRAERPDTEATEQDPLVPIGPELAAKMLGAVTEQAPREPRVWREGDRVVCPPDTEQHYPGTVTGFNDYGRPLVKWDHWHKVDAYAPDQLAEVIEDGAQ